MVTQLCVQSTTHIANSFRYQGKLPYDTLKSFIGVTPLAQQVGMLMVHPSLPVRCRRPLVQSADLSRTSGPNKVRALGMTSDKRLPQFLNVPTIGETISDFEWSAWVGAFVPAGTPTPIVDKLNGLLKQALADPAAVKLLTDATLNPMYMSPVQFDAKLHADYKKHGSLMKEIGLVK